MKVWHASLRMCVLKVTRPPSWSHFKDKKMETTRIQKHVQHFSDNYGNTDVATFKTPGFQYSSRAKNRELRLKSQLYELGFLLLWQNTVTVATYERKVFKWTSGYGGLESFTVEQRKSGWALTSWCASRRRRELTERFKLLKSQSLPPRSTGLILYKNSISWEPKFSSLGAILIQTIPMWTDNWVILWNRREQSLSSSESEAASFCLAL